MDVPLVKRVKKFFHKSILADYTPDIGKQDRFKVEDYLCRCNLLKFKSDVFNVLKQPYSTWETFTQIHVHVFTWEDQAGEYISKGTVVTHIYRYCTATSALISLGI